MKLDADELLGSVERGEWKSAKGGKRERARYSRYAKATFRKDRRLNIRLSSKDGLFADALVTRFPCSLLKKRGGPTIHGCARTSSNASSRFAG